MIKRYHLPKRLILSWFIDVDRHIDTIIDDPIPLAHYFDIFIVIYVWYMCMLFERNTNDTIALIPVNGDPILIRWICTTIKWMIIWIIYKIMKCLVYVLYWLYNRLYFCLIDNWMNNFYLHESICPLFSG